MKDRRNPEYRRIITGKRWQELRGAYMLKNAITNGGFCEQCVKNYFVGGPRPRMATEVHHIVPIERGHTRAEMEALAYNVDNLMALCSECHHELHRQMWKARFKKTQRQLDKERMREEIEKDINDYINRIKDGI